MTLETWVAIGAIVTSVIAIWGAFHASVKRLIEREVTNKLVNGDGATVTDYAHETRDLARKAVELAVMADARTRRLETKLDAHIITTTEGNGELAPRS